MMLIELAVKSSLVFSAALVALAVMRRQSAATRHVVLASAFVATLALPLLVIVGPHWRVSSLSMFTTNVQSFSRSVDGRLPYDRGLVLQSLDPSGHASSSFSHWQADDWMRLMTSVWLIGAAISAIRLFAGIASAMQLARKARPLTNSQWSDSLTSVANSTRLPHEVALRTSPHASVPLAWRLGLSCTLILPVEAERWQTDTRRAVLLHECGHLGRHDCAIRSLAVLACGVWWFNPLAYLALRRLRIEQERACDDLVLAAGVAPLGYAKELLDMARRSATANSRGAACVAMVGRSELEERMFAIVDRSRQRGALAPRARLLIITASVGLVMAVGALRMSAARTDSFTAGLMPLQTMGRGGPQFKWIREVDEETRRRVTGALDAANRDNDAKVRAVAEQALQTIRDMPDGTVTVSGQCRGNCFVGPTAFPAAETLAGLLRAPDPQVRALAAIRLDSLIFPPAVPAWIDLLVDGDDSLRERAAISLGAIGDPAAVDALASVLLNDRNADVRRQAARSLGQIAAGS